MKLARAHASSKMHALVCEGVGVYKFTCEKKRHKQTVRQTNGLKRETTEI
jgi:hypothetical protein